MSGYGAGVSGGSAGANTGGGFDAADFSWKKRVRLATTGNITLSGLQTIDGSMTAEAEDVLVKNQATASENGLYNASASGWSRSASLPVGESANTIVVGVDQGAVNGNTYFQCDNDAGTDIVGTDDLVFSKQDTSAAPALPISVSNGGTGQTTQTSGFDALSPNTAKGDLTARGTSVNIRVAVGANDQVLTADSTQGGGIKWATPGGANPGGANNALQFNNAGSFGGDVNSLSVDITNSRIGIGVAVPTSNLHMTRSATDTTQLIENTGSNFRVDLIYRSQAATLRYLIFGSEAGTRYDAAFNSQGIIAYEMEGGVTNNYSRTVFSSGQGKPMHFGIAPGGPASSWSDKLSIHSSGVSIGFSGSTTPDTALHLASGAVLRLGGPGTATGTALVRDSNGDVREDSSSSRFKTNIKSIPEGLSKKIYELRPVEYDRTDDKIHEFGLIAEEVNEVLPQIVPKDKEGKPYSVRYDRLVALLIKETKLLRREVDLLKKSA